MKLLRVRSWGFKNCGDGFGIDMIARSRKTSEDKEYELLEIDEELYVYSTVGIVGKNASGKSSLLNLLDWCYDILGTFRLGKKDCSFKGISLEMIFYEEGYLYKYETRLHDSETLDGAAVFKDQKISRKKYFKSKVKNIFDDDFEQGKSVDEEVPEDFSIVYSVLKKRRIRDIYCEESLDNSDNYANVFKLMEVTGIGNRYVPTILRIFDGNITDLVRKDDQNYLLNYQGSEKVFSDKELFHFLSSGTTKGFALYTTAVLSLKMGFDLVVDEIENHFHKTLVENLILLYKDKQVNRRNASLIFSTHYCEILDMFNRSDNIWITHADGKVRIENMYEKYDLRSELLKSKKFYQNTFDTAVNYDALMELKGKLME